MSASSFKFVDSPLAVAGLRNASTNAGIKQSERNDLCIFELGPRTNTATTFTRNRFAAAPVVVAKQHLAVQPNPRYLIINSGNANAGTGADGVADAVALCQTLAASGDVSTESVLPFSTGVIGERLPVQKMSSALSGLSDSLAADGWPGAAQAIMTTDTCPKLVSGRFSIDGTDYAITGIAKGSGMIRPDMATMLCFIGTDAAVLHSDLQITLSAAVERSFNRITVDGDTSTNDACVLMATGETEPERVLNAGHQGWHEFTNAVDEVCEALAKSIVRDGEGATKFVEINVRSETLELSESIGFTVAESPLVKTALFASDPNWGRILAAVGRAKGGDFDFDAVNIWLGEYQIVKSGSVVADYNEQAAAAEIAKSDITITIVVGAGEAAARVWTCDLSYDYVRINAEYRS